MSSVVPVKPASSTAQTSVTKRQMYYRNTRFSDLEPGDAVLYLGEIRTVDNVDDDHAVIDGEQMSKDRINNLFRSYESPFKIVDL